MDNSLLNNLQLIKFTKYFINMAYLDYFFKEQYKYDLKYTFGKKKEKKLLNKKMKDSKDNKDNNTIISENKSKKSVNVIQKVKKNCVYHRFTGFAASRASRNWSTWMGPRVGVR